MRKYTLVLLGLLLGALALAQPGKPSVRQFVRIDEVPSLTQIGSQTWYVAPDSAIRLGADGMQVSGQLAENAHCRDGKADWMRLGKARFKADTLIVSLFRNDHFYVHELEIKLWKGEFSTTYRVASRDGTSSYVIVPTDQVLVLVKADWQPGERIAGFVNFRGTRWESKAPARPWEAKMDWVESTYVVRGPFKVTIAQ